MMHQRSACAYNDGDDVEAHPIMGNAVTGFHQPLHRRMSQVDLLGSGDRLLRGAIAKGASGLDFDERDATRFAAGHDVEFAITAMPVTVENAPAAALKPCGGVLFAERADLAGG